jgi:hypothetical protein
MKMKRGRWSLGLRFKFQESCARKAFGICVCVFEFWKLIAQAERERERERRRKSKWMFELTAKLLSWRWTWLTHFRMIRDRLVCDLWLQVYRMDIVHGCGHYKDESSMNKSEGKSNLSLSLPHTYFHPDFPWRFLLCVHVKDIEEGERKCIFFCEGTSWG